MTKFQKSRIDKKPTENTNAYLLYQQGMYLWNKRTGESISNSIKLYQQAIALDSNFALPYAAIALSYHTMYVYPVENGDSIQNLVGIYARRALTIDPDLGAAHTAMGAYYAFNPDQIEKALRELDIAIELDPNYSYSWLKKAMLFHENGEAEKALMYVDHALQLDPLSPTVLLNRAIVLNLLGRSSEAMQVIKQIQLLEPGFSTPFLNELRVYVLLNMEKYSEALKISRIAGPKFLAYSYAANGNQERAGELGDSLDREGNNDVVFKIVLQFYLKGKEAAFNMMMNEINKTKPENLKLLKYDLISVDMFPNAIRSDPRFGMAKQMVGWKPLQ